MNQTLDPLVSMLSSSHSGVDHQSDHGDMSQIWILSLTCSCIVGFAGILPFLILPPDLDSCSPGLKLMIAFSVGGLLGDVFLHILPEAWSRAETHDANLSLGLWVMLGLFVFTFLEIFFSQQSVTADHKEDMNQKLSSSEYDTQQQLMNNNNKITKPSSSSSSSIISPSLVTGYLNLMANGIDNFSHGLAVAASFLVGIKIGFLTTFAILLHEVPHEFGDFAILIKSGFSKWEAAKAQAWTATIGIAGALVTLTLDSASVNKNTDWILPFTAGGFMHIALVNLLPDLVRETNAYESIKQIVAVVAGITVMASVNLLNH